MPKVKTVRAAKKRFRVTKSGEFKRSKAFNRHLKTCKSAKRRRNLRKSDMIHETNLSSIRQLLPYS